MFKILLTKADISYIGLAKKCYPQFDIDFRFMHAGDPNLDFSCQIVFKSPWHPKLHLHPEKEINLRDGYVFFKFEKAPE